MPKQIQRSDLIEIKKHIYEIAQEFRSDMRVPARLFASESMLDDILHDRAVEQLVNVSTLPGIQKYAFAMPDIHQGYGFPIGGVAATAIHEGGVISPGGIGYDINCGVRLLALNMSKQEIKPYLEQLATALFHAVPSGVGQGGKIKLDAHEMNRVLKDGAKEMIRQGFGVDADLQTCEEHGSMPINDADSVTDQAKRRGADQLGTLGSGNHFLEVQTVDQIYDAPTAQAFGLSQDQVVIMVHCGSRGLGHQTCTDNVRIMMHNAHKWNIQLPDRELICAPFDSTEAQHYFDAMSAAANFAWANRHLIGHWIRQTCQKVIGSSITVRTIYDVSHNLGKRETHLINGEHKELLVHRKGATRAFGPNDPRTTELYRTVGQPVLIPGTMGTASYVLVGSSESMEIAFGSSCHGAGRRLSRTQAKKSVRGTQLRQQLEHQGIIVRCDSDAGLAEEAPIAYKDVDNVVNVVHEVGLARKVVRVTPLAVIKGG